MTLRRRVIMSDIIDGGRATRTPFARRKVLGRMHTPELQLTEMPTESGIRDRQMKEGRS